MDDASIIPESGREAVQEDRAYRRLVRSVALTQDEEIDCTTCLEQVPAYVERDLAGSSAAEEMPALHVHLMQCGDCFEEYQVLRDLVELDASSGLPDAATLLRQLEGC
jgi:hypothetical protein